MRKLLMFTLVIILVMIILSACSSNSSAGNNIDGAALLQSHCTECHSIKTVTREALTQSQWQQVVDNMVQRGAQLNSDEKSTLIAYLAETYPAK
jgi:ABC-type Fe3+-hydroxamate transport system substrate-binding protein